jgi:hypothetical protein
MSERNVGVAWSTHEDSLLTQAVALYGESDKWKTIASCVPGRTNKACRKVRATCQLGLGFGAQYPTHPSVGYIHSLLPSKKRLGPLRKTRGYSSSTPYTTQSGLRLRVRYQVMDTGKQ